MRFRASREPIQIWPFSSLAARMCALVPLTSMSRITCRGQSRPCSRRLPSWGNDSARAATSATGSLNWLSWMSTCSRPCCRDSTPFSGTPTTWNVTRPVSIRGLMWAFCRKRSRARSIMGSRASRDWTSLWVSTQPASPENAATLSPGATFTQPGTWALGRQERAKGRPTTPAAAKIRMAAGRRMVAPGRGYASARSAFMTGASGGSLQGPERGGEMRAAKELLLFRLGQQAPDPQGGVSRRLRIEQQLGHDRRVGHEYRVAGDLFEHGARRELVAGQTQQDAGIQLAVRHHAQECCLVLQD